MGRTRAVDVHHHYFPPAFAKAWSDVAGTSDRVVSITNSWSVAQMIEHIDRAAVQTAILSNNDRAFTSRLSPDRRRLLARECNEFGASIAREHPGRVKHFTYLPMPDIETSLEEIAFGFDVLDAAGVHLMTSYDDTWPGDKKLAPVLEELDRRKAIVFCHPRVPRCCAGIMPELSAEALILLEYPFDTGRAVLSLLLSGSLARFPNIRWLFCHTGSVVVVMAERLKHLAPLLLPSDAATFAPHGIEHELQRLYWDTGFYPATPAMNALLAFSPLDRILFGSDFPFVDVATNRDSLGLLHLSDEQLLAIERDNALRLWPQLLEPPNAEAWGIL